MERLTVDKMSIIEGLTPEEPYNLVTSGTMITNLGNFYINLFFICKYYKDSINVLMLKDEDHINLLEELLDNINITYEPELDLDKWRHVKDLIIICDRIEVKDIEYIKPLAVSCTFDVNTPEQFLKGNIYIVPFSDINSYSNRIFIEDIERKVYNIEKYKLMCNYINNKQRKKIIYSNKFSDNELDESIAIYIAMYYIYRFKRGFSKKYTKLEKTLNELQEYIMNRIEHEVIDFEVDKEKFVYKNKTYFMDEFINNSKLMEFICISSIKEGDRKRLLNISEDKTFRHIINTYPITMSKKYNQNDFIKKVSNVETMLSYIDYVRVNLIYDDKGYNFTLLDNCSVKKFTVSNFHDRIFNLIRLNNINYTKENDLIIQSFFDKCVELLTI